MGLSTENISLIEIEVQGQSFQVEVVQVPFTEGFRLICQLDEDTLSIEDRGMGLDVSVENMRQCIERYLSDYA